MSEMVMNVGGMTLEGFFLADYERLRAENAELRDEVEKLRPSGYGLFDLGHPTECAKLDVMSFTSYDVKYDGITSDNLRDALEMDDESLWKWAHKMHPHRKTSWYTPFSAISECHRTFQYTIRVVETRSSTTFVTDASMSNDDCTMFNIKEYDGQECVGIWQDAKRFERMKKAALDMLRETLRQAIPRVEQQESKEEAEQ